MFKTKRKQQKKQREKGNDKIKKPTMCVGLGEMGKEKSRHMSTVPEAFGQWPNCRRRVKIIRDMNLR